MLVALPGSENRIGVARFPRLPSKTSSCRARGRVHADRHVQVPVGPAELTGGEGRDRPGQRNLLRLADPTLAVAGEEIEAAAACRAEHVGPLITVEVARLEVADRLGHAHCARVTGEPLGVVALLHPLEDVLALRCEGIRIAALKRDDPRRLRLVSGDQVRRTVAVEIRARERARPSVIAGQCADECARPVVHGA